ncbi:MAG: DUF58 domain-containing protein [Firmicutes bacterium]|nr:DUF58 domain-containing protein [Bacillota bacterium]
MSVRRNRILCALVLIAVLAVYIWTNEKLAFYLLVILLVCLAVSVFSSLLAGRLLRGEVSLTGGQEGRGSLHISLRNRMWLPVFFVRMKIVLRNLLTGSEAPVERVRFLLPGQTSREEIPIESMYIGRVEADIGEAIFQDAFGLVRGNFRASSAGSFEQYPVLQIMEDEMQWERDKSQKYMDRYLHRKGNDPSEILDIREYRRGDNVRRIHWKLTARLRKTMMRELDMPSDQDTLVVFALQQEPAGEAIHKLVSYALNLSWNLLKQEVHHNVLVLSEDGQLLQSFNVASGEDYNYLEQRILEGGIALTAELLETYMEQQQTARKYSQILYVTDTEPQQYFPYDNVTYLRAEQ